MRRWEGGEGWEGGLGRGRATPLRSDRGAIGQGWWRRGRVSGVGEPRPYVRTWGALGRDGGGEAGSRAWASHAPTFGLGGVGQGWWR